MTLSRSRIAITTALILFPSCQTTGGSSRIEAEAEPETALAAYIERRVSEFSAIDTERRTDLDALSEELANWLRQGQELPMTFICTHNSRRSHMAQIWAQCAARRHGLYGVRTFSGGTEATAFNPRAVAAIQRAGLTVEIRVDGENPVYVVEDGQGDGMRCWSKVFSDDANPSANFVAVMTCQSADEACPFVPGAGLRVALPYVDPKAFDGTSREAAAYDERCAQIAREMFYLFAEVGKRLDRRWIRRAARRRRRAPRARGPRRSGASS